MDEIRITAECFMNELNQKYFFIKFDSKFDCKQIEFFDTLVYVD